MACFIYQTSIGNIYIEETNNYITKLQLVSNNLHLELQNTPMNESPLTKKAFLQLEEYFKGKRTSFDLPLNPKGTPFPEKSWNALLTIPYGQTKSYLDIATIIGNPKAVRAVGLANHNNPIMIVIPCHRVIGKNGKMVGYACGISVKEQLLSLEKEVCGI